MSVYVINEIEHQNCENQRKQNKKDYGAIERFVLKKTYQTHLEYLMAEKNIKIVRWWQRCGFISTKKKSPFSVYFQ